MADSQQNLPFGGSPAQGKPKAPRGQGTRRKKAPAARKGPKGPPARQKGGPTRQKGAPPRQQSGAKRQQGVPPRKRPPADRSAEEMARRQRDISVSEFFAKNRHLLGFDNPAKALLTTVKELVDNALDAADEARIPADVEVKIDELAEDRFRVTCTDNGPGIVAKNVPMVFGKLLFGSKFHRLKMSRGQQGIGVSAAGMYGLLTTGHPVRVISRTAKNKPAMRFEIAIDTQKNQPSIKSREEIDWHQERGTSVEIELEATYRKGQHSVDNYIRQISIANPHAHISYLPPDRTSDEDVVVFPRVTEDLPPETAEIRPHPYGVELGVLMQMLRESKSRNLSGFLSSEFTRVSTRTAQEICTRAKLEPRRRPAAMDRAGAEALHKAIARTKIMAPPTDCIAPIGEELLMRALESIHPGEFTTALTRRPAVYRGNPFLVEVALSFGGSLPAEDSIALYRYANRVPLQYQQGACAITRAVSTTDWRKYGLQHPRGALPIGPVVALVHIASVWVPFTSESKEAIAHYPEIIKEIRLGLQDCGRRLSIHINRRRREADEEKKRSYIQKYIPHVAIALQQILSFSDKERDETIATLTGILERSRKL
jgi:DNA topoisomerase-6 subunit B